MIHSHASHLRLYYFILITFFTPILTTGQNVAGRNNDVISMPETYAIIKTVITEEKLNKKLGLDLLPAKNSNINTEDSVYLLTLLIDPEEQDNNKDTAFSNFVPAKVEWPDKNLLSGDDISYMLDTKSKLKQFKWDNKKLGFNLGNKKYYYTFSIPLFNTEHNIALLMYESLCPGLCGRAQTIILKKEDDGWKIYKLMVWFY